MLNILASCLTVILKARGQLSFSAAKGTMYKKEEGGDPESEARWCEDVFSSDNIEKAGGEQGTWQGREEISVWCLHLSDSLSTPGILGIS